tara:strand:+ start:36 stop:1343 length:1308 start_codon:yes stop_codon:yes gene_type:complete
MENLNNSNLYKISKEKLLKVNNFPLNLVFFIRIFLIILFLLILFKPVIFSMLFKWHLPEHYPFLDLKGRLSHIEAHRMGINTYMEPNPIDPLRRVNNKPSISLMLSFSGIGLKDYLWIGSIVVGTFLLQAVSIIRKSNVILILISSLCIFSPNSLFAIERGNDDLIVFLISYFLPYLIIVKKRASYFLAIAFVWLLGALKYYPFVLFSLLINKRLKYFRFNIYLIIVGIIVWIKLFWNELLFLTNYYEGGSLPLTPTSINAFKILDISLLIKNMPGYDLRMIYGNNIHFVFICLFLLSSTLVYFIINKEYFLLKNKLIKINQIDKLYFLIGSTMLVFCYLTSDNNSYRMIHSIFLLPLILKLIDVGKMTRYMYPRISLLFLMLLLVVNWLPLLGTLLVLKIKITLDYILFCMMSGFAIFLLRSGLSISSQDQIFR